MLICGFRLWCLSTMFSVHLQPPTPLEIAASTQIPQRQQKAEEPLGCPPPPPRTTSKPERKAPDLWTHGKTLVNRALGGMMPGGHKGWGGTLRFWEQVPKSCLGRHQKVLPPHKTQSSLQANIYPPGIRNGFFSSLVKHKGLRVISFVWCLKNSLWKLCY